MLPTAPSTPITAYSMAMTSPPMSWLLDPAPATKFFSNGESIPVASPAYASTAMYHAVCDIKGLLVSLKCLSDLSHRGLMFALGQKQALQHLQPMSALPPESGHQLHFAARSNGGEVWNSASGCLVLSASGRGTRDERDLLSRQREIAMAWTSNDDVR